MSGYGLDPGHLSWLKTRDWQNWCICAFQSSDFGKQQCWISEQWSMIIIDGHLSAFARVDNCLDASFLPPISHHCKHLETLLKRCKTKGATGANLAIGACRTTWPGGTRGTSWRQSVGNSDSGFQVFAMFLLNIAEWQPMFQFPHKICAMQEAVLEGVLWTQPSPCKRFKKIYHVAKKRACLERRLEYSGAEWSRK